MTFFGCYGYYNLEENIVANDRYLFDGLLFGIDRRLNCSYLSRYIYCYIQGGSARIAEYYKMIHHWKCKLTEETVEEIYIELREGTVSQDIADMFNVSRGLVDHVNYGRSWPVTGLSYPIRKRNKPVKVLGHDEYPIEDCYPCTEWEKRNG